MKASIESSAEKTAKKAYFARMLIGKGERTMGEQSNLDAQELSFTLTKTEHYGLDGKKMK